MHRPPLFQVDDDADKISRPVDVFEKPPPEQVVLLRIAVQVLFRDDGFAGIRRSGAGDRQRVGGTPEFAVFRRIPARGGVGFSAAPRASPGQDDVDVRRKLRAVLFALTLHQPLVAHPGHRNYFREHLHTRLGSAAQPFIQHLPADPYLTRQFGLSSSVVACNFSKSLMKG